MIREMAFREIGPRLLRQPGGVQQDRLVIRQRRTAGAAYVHRALPGPRHHPHQPIHRKTRIPNARSAHPLHQPLHRRFAQAVAPHPPPHGEQQQRLRLRQIGHVPGRFRLVPMIRLNATHDGVRSVCLAAIMQMRVIINMEKRVANWTRPGTPGTTAPVP